MSTVTVKAEKRANGHAGTTRAKGKQAVQDEDEEEQQEQEGEAPEADGEQGDEAGPSRKRVRSNTMGDAREVEEEEEEKYVPRQKIETMARDKDGYIPGSIMRIQVKNFVTYDFTEFTLGPYLNMIIGPNGTGKSTIACAICLGLGWPASTLGRASDVNTFIKLGTEEGYIEIELKGPSGKKNLVIRRILKASSKFSPFTLNGKGVTAKEIAAQMAALNVQVGNLCTFLPQDKVSSFAHMSPQDLLKETQRAAGDTNLTDWHQTLIDQGGELKKTADTIQAEADQLQQMKDRNDAIERDVERYKERKRIEQEMKLLEVCIPVQTYLETRDRYNEVRAKKKIISDRCKVLKDKNAPAHQFQKDLEQKVLRLERERDDCKKGVQATFRKINNKVNDIEKCETACEEWETKLESLDREEKARANKINNIKSTLEKLRAELAKDVKIESDDTVNNELRDLRTERQSVTERKNQFDSNKNIAIQQYNHLRQQRDAKQHEINKLGDVDVRKMYNLKKYSQETADAVEWLRKNQDKFEKPIIEPAYLTVNVTDKNLASQVEACFNRNSQLTFVAQSKEDYNTFNRLVNDSTVVTGHRIRVTAWFRPELDHMKVPPPMSQEELRSLGFAGYVLDCITYPEGMRWFLECDLSAHRIAIGPSNLNVEAASRAVTRADPPANFINGMTFNQVTRSRYGKRLTQNTTRSIMQARTFVQSAVDPEMKTRLEGELRTLHQLMAEAEEGIKSIQAQMVEVEEEDARFDMLYQGLMERKNKILEAHKARQQMKSREEQGKKELRRLQGQASADEERNKIKQRLEDEAKNALRHAKEYRNLVSTVSTEQQKNSRLSLEYIQLHANLIALRELCQIKDAGYQKAYARLTQVVKIVERYKTEAHEALKASRVAIDSAEEEIQHLHNERSERQNEYKEALKQAEENGTEPPSKEGVDLRTLDELEEEMETQRTKLELIHSTNPGVMEEYEKRKRDIEVLERTLETKRAAAARIEKTINRARQNWEPALRALVEAIGEKFSKAFDSIGCAGEIRVSPHEDYDKWAIDILVKFRDEEKLQLLTGQRQSGGERSLTTILYLMSLTEQARAPFSLVDEINQGMDQRAERLVHNNMVRVTCQDDAGQYFLITPKLLPDLQYHPRMKVLCVNNGEWLPEETGLGNMKGMIEGFVARSRMVGGQND
ncbi:P-loop containing nucleoside triphosphate hydrolase protein [Cylindrobasidium torrendii FP15055 ss-10]|uniref:Structural maintenance of chromosomes protein 5 n=1 Tax=Cylindrobasidium torrendii FP15055 ss-10 TaxID=1314674 RepID=A0A0D7B4D3_9AGAR|nr:P-loop containing nucleoside triphosphate hydrolase protein [Cylindrobasidium torrendii FP15055 ss-10]